MARKKSRRVARPAAIDRGRVDSPPKRDSKLELARGAALPSMMDPAQRVAWGFNADPHQPDPYMIELNLRYPGGLTAAAQAFRELLATLPIDAGESLTRITSSYFRCWMTVAQWSELIARDEQWEVEGHASQIRGDLPWVRCIYRIWPDFLVQPLVDGSIATVKADAALRSFAASGRDIVWAVIDSGVQADHPHFGPADDAANHRLHNPQAFDLHRDFTGREPAAEDPLDADEPAPPSLATAKSALVDGLGHGTHVAGIIAGRAPESAVAFERVFVATSDTDHQVTFRQRSCDPQELRGVAPDCSIVSLKVLNDSGGGRSSDVIRALAYVRRDVNRNPKLMRIHGVNLSLGYEFDAEMFACGQSPLCAEVDRLVQSGVVVVTAAGNTGWGVATSVARVTRVGFSASINDPGNAARAITVDRKSVV